MALSDCDKCWDSPCRCGWDYRDWSVNARLELAAAVLGIERSELELLVAFHVPDPHPKKS